LYRGFSAEEEFFGADFADGVAEFDGFFELDFFGRRVRYWSVSRGLKPHVSLWLGMPGLKSGPISEASFSVAYKEPIQGSFPFGCAQGQDKAFEGLAL
jgi:hypothetical protein